MDVWDERELPLESKLDDDTDDDKMKTNRAKVIFGVAQRIPLFYPLLSVFDHVLAPLWLSLILSPQALLEGHYQ